MHTLERSRGFTLIELMIAMAITAGMSAIVFNLFLQNQNVFRDQNLVIEMQQSVRAVASMMADEIRMAGQGVPTYAGSMDTTSNAESIQTLLNGTDDSTIVFRAGVEVGIGTITGFPVTFSVGTSTTVTVSDVTAIHDVIGSNTNRYVFVWGQTATSWSWVRSRVSAINTGTNVITMTPGAIGVADGTFPDTPNIYAEEALGYRLSSGNIQRGTSGDFTTQTAPVMTYSTVGENFTALAFSYFDADGNAVTITDVDDRASVRRVEFRLVAQTSQDLPSTGERRTFEITMTVYPRNVSLY